MKTIISGVLLLILGIATLFYNRSQVAIGGSEANNTLVVGLALLAMLIGLVAIDYAMIQRASTNK